MVIGLIGNSGGGKSAVAKILETQCGFQVVSIGSHIRRELGSYIDSHSNSQVWVDDEKWNDPRMPIELRAILSLAIETHVGSQSLWAKPTPLWARRALQLWGSEYSRMHFGDDYWCKLLAEEIIPLVKAGKYVVIEDCRLDSEIDLVRYCASQGCLSFVVDVFSGVYPASVMQHSTETVYIENHRQWRDYVLLNPKHTGLDCLSFKVVHMFNTLKGVANAASQASK